MKKITINKSLTYHIIIEDDEEGTKEYRTEGNGWEELWGASWEPVHCFDKEAELNEILNKEWDTNTK